MAPPSPALSTNIFDRYLWVGAGIFAVYAAYTVHSQLSTFKARCVSKPPPSSSNDAAVDRTTEDAIRLETLEALARGINFDLRNAALKIITERATTAENINVLVKQIESRNVSARLRALKAMRCLLVTSTSFSKLCDIKVYRALVTCLKNTLPPTPDPVTEKGALYILARMTRCFPAGRDMALQAGIVDWLKLLKIPGYSNLIEAISDQARSDTNDSLCDIVSAIMDERMERRFMIEAGLIPRSGDDEERGVEVEIEVEVEVGGVAVQRHVQATPFDSLLENGLRESEVHWGLH